AIVIQRVFAAGEPRRAAGHLNTLVAAQARVGRRSGGEIQVDVVRHEEIETAVPVVIEKGAAGAPPRAGVRDPRAIGHLLKAAVAAVVIQTISSPVADEQIVVAVVVVIADAGALSPSARRKPRARGHVGERAIAL